MTSHLFSPSFMRVAATVGAAFMALLVLAIRMKASKRPASLRKIIIPPIAMSSGFLMFLVPETHIPFQYAATAFASGLLLSIPLIRTSEFHTSGKEIYLKRSRAFVFVLLGLLALRLAMHSLVEEYITLPQTGAVFFILAFGMISMWRIVMVLRFLEMSRWISERYKG